MAQIENCASIPPEKIARASLSLFARRSRQVGHDLRCQSGYAAAET
ncbi:MAG: hypothetical protein RIB84_12660 [Sneathiellaceae bacterium]